MTTPVLKVDDLTVSFRVNGIWRPAVSNLSFEIAPKETVAIVGESGSGKSVTALSIMRLVPTANGRVDGAVLLDGRDLSVLPESDMRAVRGNDISMIFQEPMTSLNPVLTIGFQIAETLRYHRGLDHRSANAEALRILDTVRIPAAASRFGEYPHRFSGGMRQRVMIAMALACRPKVLIADEPTTALDVTVQAQILELIKMLQDDLGMAVIFITHDMGVVAEVADRTIVMFKGEAVEQNQTSAVFRKPQHGYTRALLAAVPKLGSMAAHASPIRFPVVDANTGVAEEPTAASDTVSESAALLLDVRNLVTRFDVRGGMLGRVTGRVHAVENVSFSLKDSETLALVGESGCGKSTTGRAILRLVPPTSGQVLFEGRDVAMLQKRDLRAMRQRMQMIFQDPYASLNPRKTAGAAIAEPLIIHGLADRQTAAERVTELMRKVGLSPDMADRLPHEFSGGQRQRLCIARALALSPRLIVADEAVSALDVSIKAQVINLMLDLQQELGIAYLFISHDMAVVERISHRVAVMHLGEIVEIGPRAAIFGNPQHAYTKKLIEAVPSLDPDRLRIRRGLSNDEIPSPFRKPDYQPPERRYREMSPGHLVQVVD
jgi:peptide/nickel transport system ATP-binding protein